MTSRKNSLKSTNKRMTRPKLKPKPKPKPTHKPTGTTPEEVPSTTDRISKLPDHILHHILSFLPLQEAGRTSILSHRWIHVWVSMQGLKFYTDEFANCGPDKFISYVNAALPYRSKQDLQVFKTFLFNDSPTNIAASTRWITHALKNDVRVLHIIIRLKNSGENVIVPRPMLTSRSLEELGLFSFPNVRIITPNVISLSQLKILSLQHMDVNSAFMEKIISGCPRLENLNLHCCWLSCLGISSRMLRNLVMEKCEIQNQRENEFYICTPNLENLHFNQKYVVCSPRVNVYYWLLKLDFRSLKLDIPNLKSLILGGYWVARDPAAVTFFLQHSPMLEKLTLICKEVYRKRRDVEPLNMSSDLCFQCKNLNSVDIIGNKSDKNIPHLTEVLKRNGIANLNLTLDSSSVFGDDCLKMLYDVWFWINYQSIYT
ncbi:F-box/LRR-repeat protein [Carex littledalei]|uniref:F-box/LRR-repeat protein n=1 Tax=Carex littledalei TaxID=544730 RepID=A0A833VHV2_9POAL|nr:F-box/LRR-repeat protein [Carex littledalei]